MKKFFLLSFFIIIIFSLLTNKTLYGSNLKSYPHIKAELILNLSQGILKGNALIELPSKKYYKINIKNLVLKKILLDNLSFSPLIEEETLGIITKEKPQILYLEFETHIKVWSSPLILIENFLPFPNVPSSYTLSIKLEASSEEWDILIPYDQIEKKYIENVSTLYTFSINSPISAPYLVLGKFKKSTLKFEKYALQVFYFSPNFIKNFETKSASLKKLFSYYEEIVGPFPYKNIFILENPLKSPKELPNLLVLEENEIKKSNWEQLVIKKFITNLLSFGIRLTEKILIKGLTEYLVDYQFSPSKELFRKNYLSLPETEGIGFFYIFNLAESLGEKNFFFLLKKFLNTYLYSKVSLEDFQNFFSSYPLNLFHKINLSGKINFLIENKDGYILELLLFQTLPLRNEVLTIGVETETGWETFQVKLNKLKEKVEVKLKSKPIAIYLDPEYKLWRNLSSEEIEPVLSTLFSSAGTIVCSEKDFAFYQKIINLFREKGYKLILENPILPQSLKENILYLQEPPFPELKNLPFKEGFYLKIFPHPYTSQHLIGFIWASSSKEIELALNQLFSLDSFSEIFIKKGKILLSNKYPSSRGIKIPIQKNYWAVELNSVLSLEELVKKLLDTQIILVGLNFSEFSDYNFLDEFLKTLSKSRIPLIIGLGELPKSFQKNLDEFMNNRLSTKELKDMLSEFPYKKFHEKILLWAKDNNVKVLAMDVEEDLFKKVWAKGLKELSLEEKLKLPEIDLFNPPYKIYLESSLWQSLKGTQFENFYQAEVLKNEHLAEYLISSLKKHSNYKIVFFSEKHRIIYGWGIPKNLQKREIDNFKILILDKNIFDNPNVGDFWIKIE